MYDALGIAGAENTDGVPETPEANVIASTLAGSGKAGFLDALTARFKDPWAVD